ncbi:MAG: DUF975 family protein [Bacillota bacterium]|nr:DUF975 family protein [Bacillota bacterium]
MNEGVFYRIFVRRQAKVTVLKNLPKCCGVALIYLGINFAFVMLQLMIENQFETEIYSSSEITISVLPILIILLELFVMSPVTLGLLEFFMRLSDGKPVSVGDIFLWFGEGKRYIKSVLINFQFSFLVFAFTFLGLILPVAASVTFSYMGNTAALYVLVPIMFIIMAFVAARLLTYLPGLFFLAEDMEKKPWKCLMESRKMFKKRKWDLFLMVFGFLGWFFLVVLFGSVGSQMAFASYGYNVPVEITSIPLNVTVGAAIAAYLASALLLLFVIPYWVTSVAYYIRGVQNPGLFHNPAAEFYAKRKEDVNGSQDKNSDAGNDGEK